MRIPFEAQLVIGQIPISQTPISTRGKDEMDDVLIALLTLFNNKEWKRQLFDLLDKHLNTPKNVAKSKVGRHGLTLWQIFVLAQVRLCLNADYTKLHNLANNHHAFRVMLGIEYIVLPKIRTENLIFLSTVLQYDLIYKHIQKISNRTLGIKKNEKILNQHFTRTEAGNNFLPLYQGKKSYSRFLSALQEIWTCAFE